MLDDCLKLIFKENIILKVRRYLFVEKIVSFLKKMKFIFVISFLRWKGRRGM